MRPVGCFGHILLYENGIGAQAVSQFLTGIGVDVGEDHLCAVGHKHFGMRLAHTLRCARDDRNFTRKPVHNDLSFFDGDDMHCPGHKNKCLF